MSRKPSVDKPSFATRQAYITHQGAKILKDELDFLWKQKRPEVTQAVSEAAAMGDRSENAEYIYGKRQLRQIDSRIRFLRKRLENITVVDRLPDDQSKIFFGAMIEIENDQTEEILNFRIVGPDEIDPEKKQISIHSPMSKAVLGKSVDDEIVIRVEDNEQHYSIISINYPSLELQPTDPPL
ncbi:transcription elongation factor GreB [Pelagibaculum spongiae]|uniref:Transcription elongation factor GreB n=1 Tax=Pelagibaculum spongiae TaxID=2080658 RepID=A0A2V1GQP9_9GAMM|nr:transcription elongation factor GreB [Pelagibaculum spongiae]PVZ64330.1 transcription elongation factor GreB [Pelagibaculum spongiae]